MMDDRAGAFYAMEDFGIIDFLSAQKCSFLHVPKVCDPAIMCSTAARLKVELINNAVRSTEYSVQEIEGGYP